MTETFTHQIDLDDCTSMTITIVKSDYNTWGIGPLVIKNHSPTHSCSVTLGDVWPLIETEKLKEKIDFVAINREFSK